MNIPWPVVQDVGLIAAGLQLVLAVAGHFVGFLGRHLLAGGVLVSLLTGFAFGVSASPASPASAALGGAIVAGASAAAGIVLSYFLGDAKAVSIVVSILGSAAAGALAGAIGRAIGHSTFG